MKERTLDCVTYDLYKERFDVSVYTFNWKSLLTTEGSENFLVLRSLFLDDGFLIVPTERPEVGVLFPWDIKQRLTGTIL